jgi:tRNA(fMet)-specific endonuclease VapC
VPSPSDDLRLDTDILSLLGHKTSPEAPRIRRRIAELPAEHSVVTTVINYEEQMRGWMAALSQAKSPESEVQVYARLLQHLATYRHMIVFAYNESAATIAGRLRQQHLSVGTMDLKIASIVLASKAILITRNVADFRQVPGLRVEDWSLENEP